MHRRKVYSLALLLIIVWAKFKRNLLKFRFKRSMLMSVDNIGSSSCSIVLSNEYVKDQLNTWTNVASERTVCLPLLFIVEDAVSESKLGSYLKSKQYFPSTNKAHHACHDGIVYVNGRPEYSSYRVKAADEIRLNSSYVNYGHTNSSMLSNIKYVSRLANFTNSLLREDRNPPVHVIYEDDYFGIVFKPAGVHSMKWLSTMKKQIFALDDILPCILKAPDLPVNNEVLSRPIPCHRLDSRVCGCLVVAKTALALNHISQAFSTRQVQKCYTALLVGKINLSQRFVSLHSSRLDEPVQYLISFPIGGRPSQSILEVLESASCNVYGQMHRVKLTLLTGRHHQLRIHCALLGSPILGDDLYHSAATLPSVEERVAALNALASQSKAAPDDEDDSTPISMNIPASTLLDQDHVDADEAEPLPKVRRGQGMFLMSNEVSLTHPQPYYLKEKYDESVVKEIILENGMREKFEIDANTGAISVKIDEIPRFVKVFDKAKKGAAWTNPQLP